MASASAVQVARWVLAAGWSGPEAVTATAIALRSGADPDKPSGLFGIGSKGSGSVQAAAAYAFWKGRGFDSFPAYRDRSYLLLMPIAAPAVAGAAAAGVGAAATSTVETVQDTAAATANAAEQVGRAAAFLTMPEAWNRITKLFVGGAIIVVAVLYVGKRGTFDQGVRFLRTLGDNADFIVTARGAGATTPGKAKPPPASGGGGKHRAGPP